MDIRNSVKWPKCVIGNGTVYQNTYLNAVSSPTDIHKKWSSTFIKNYYSGQIIRSKTKNDEYRTVIEISRN